MLQSRLFTKTKKEIPSDETSKNAQLLLRAGYIHKEMAGVYSWLPLGLRVVNNIKEIISQEMQKLGSEEIIMSTIQDKSVWEKTDRWNDEKVDIWFKSKLKNDTEIGFGWSHEEPITNMVQAFAKSYKDFPVVVHQFQNKMRNETRAKAGVMRCREFVMKDMYSFFDSETALDEFYKKTIDAYMNVYGRVGLSDITYITSASGGVFTDKFSHEFQTVCEAGEDNIYIHKEKKIALNEEIFNEETLSKMNLKESDFELKKAAEVGNIFNFGTGKTDKMDYYFTDTDGEKKSVYLGSYGIGVTRLVGVIVEALSDDKGIIWPESVAPFSLHIVSLAKSENEESFIKAKYIYDKFIASGVEVLFDNRLDKSVGEKLSDSDLIGIPIRVVVSQKSLENGGVEVKERKASDGEIISIENFIHTYTKDC